MATATGANTQTTMNGFFKDLYADKLENLIPDGVKLYNMIPFAKKDSQLGK